VGPNATLGAVRRPQLGVTHGLVRRFEERFTVLRRASVRPLPRSPRAPEPEGEHEKDDARDERQPRRHQAEEHREGGYLRDRTRCPQHSSVEACLELAHLVGERRERSAWRRR